MGALDNYAMTYAFITGPLSPSAIQLVDDGKGDIYMVGPGDLLYLSRVYPSLDKKGVNFIQHIPGLHPDVFTCIRINGRKILLCMRPNPYKYDYDYKESEIGYLIVDFKGSIIQKAAHLDYKNSAFMKSLPAFLPGQIADDEKGRTIFSPPCFDFTRLKDGNIVLAVTARDEKNELCVYHVKFNPDGEIIKPGDCPTITPTSFSGRTFPQISKTGLSTVIPRDKKGDYTVKKQVFWGYDDKGVFYWESIPLGKDSL